MCSVPTWPPWIIFVDPPRHTKLRALVAGAFTPEVVTHLEPRVTALAVQLLEPAMRGNTMDFAAEVAIPLPLMVIAEMIGMPGEDWPKLRQWSDVFLSLSQTIGSREAGVSAGANFRGATAEMNQYLVDMIERRRTFRGNDVLSRLVHAEVDGERLTDREIIGFVQLLLVAGNETTTNLLNNALLCFMEHQTELKRLQDQPELLKSAIEEVLRYRSPFQFMFRATRKESKIGDVTIPSGKRVLAMIGSANRDASMFLDPDAVRYRPPPESSPRFRTRQSLLPWCCALKDGGSSSSPRVLDARRTLRTHRSAWLAAPGGTARLRSGVAAHSL
jgi:cytochrome P450